MSSDMMTPEEEHLLLLLERTCHYVVHHNLIPDLGGPAQLDSLQQVISKLRRKRDRLIWIATEPVTP